MHDPERTAHRARAWGVTAGCIVLAATFPWVNSEWKGGWLQALGGAALLAVPAGLATWGTISAPTSRPARATLRVLLGVAVLASLAGVYSYGILTTPWLLAPLWLAARRAGPRERYIWVAFAAPCAYLVGWLLSAQLEHRVTNVPSSFTILVVLLFWLSTRTAEAPTATNRHTAPPRSQDAGS